MFRRRSKEAVSDEVGKYSPEMQALIDSLLQDPTQGFECSHGGEPAVGIYDVPKGCVALRGMETQKLCPQHVLTNGSFEGMYCIVDLSVNAAWSIYRGETPDYVMVQDSATGLITMMEFPNSPFVEMI